MNKKNRDWLKWYFYVRLLLSDLALIFLTLRRLRHDPFLLIVQSFQVSYTVNWVEQPSFRVMAQITIESRGVMSINCLHYNQQLFNTTIKKQKDTYQRGEINYNTYLLLWQINNNIYCIVNKLWFYFLITCCFTVTNI